MGSSKMAMLVPLWILMALWLTFVSVAAVNHTKQRARDIHDS
jgi:hypothetical protein